MSSLTDNQIDILAQSYEAAWQGVKKPFHYEEVLTALEELRTLREENDRLIDKVARLEAEINHLEALPYRGEEQ